MKHFNIVMIVLCILFNGCKKTATPPDVFPVVQQIVNYDSIYSDKDDIIGAVINMEIVDNVIITQSENDDYCFSFIDVDKGKLLTKWGKKGQGAEEYVQISRSFSVLDRRLVFLDNTKRELNYVPFSVILERDSAAKTVKEPYPETADFRVRNMVVVGNKKIITGALNKGHFGIIDSENKIIDHPFDYPFSYNEITGIYRNVVFFSLLKSNNRQRKFAISILMSDIFEIYQVNDTNIVRTYISPFNHIPQIIKRQGKGLPAHTFDGNNSIAGLSEMSVSEKYICFAYSSENDDKWRSSGMEITEILCFDWNGNKIRKYILPFPIHRFCIDDSHIYGLRYFSDTETVI